MGEVVPYLASIDWYAALLETRLKGKTLKEARWAADIACGITGKMRTRALLYGNNHEPQLLSVPIHQGARAIKQVPPQNLIVANHDNWEHTHIHALEAALGSTPYFYHISKELNHILEGSRYGYFRVLTGRINDILCKSLNLPKVNADIKKAKKDNPERMAAIRQDVLDSLPSPHCSLLEGYSFVGPEILFALIK